MKMPWYTVLLLAASIAAGSMVGEGLVAAQEATPDAGVAASVPTAPDLPPAPGPGGQAVQYLREAERDAGPATAAQVAVPTDLQMVQAAGELRTAIASHDWGLAVAVGALLLCFLFVRLVLPQLHGGMVARVGAGVVAWLSYVAWNVVSGMEVADIIYTVILGGLLAAVSIWAPPATPPARSTVDVNFRPAGWGEAGKGASMVLLCLVSAALVMSAGCGTITPAVKAGGATVTKGYVRYVQADATLDPAQKAERTEDACNHRTLLGLDALPECTPGGVP